MSLMGTDEHNTILVNRVGLFQMCQEYIETKKQMMEKRKKRIQKTLKKEQDHQDRLATKIVKTPKYKCCARQRYYEEKKKVRQRMLVERRKFEERMLKLVEKEIQLMETLIIKFYLTT